MANLPASNALEIGILSLFEVAIQEPWSTVQAHAVPTITGVGDKVSVRERTIIIQVARLT
jgi:hypothetical protein